MAADWYLYEQVNVTDVDLQWLRVGSTRMTDPILERAETDPHIHIGSTDADYEPEAMRELWSMPRQLTLTRARNILRDYERLGTRMGFSPSRQEVFDWVKERLGRNVYTLCH